MGSEGLEPPTACV